jgi:hypothetical protein
MVPVWLPPAEKPSDAILAMEASLLARDGAYHVGQLYFAKQADASFVRRLEAEKIVERQVREQARLARIGEQEQPARVCVWCPKPITEGETFIEIAGRNLHQSCAAEFDEWVYGSARQTGAV